MNIVQYTNAKYSRGMALPIVVLIIVILAIGGFFWLKNSDEPEDDLAQDDSMMDEGAEDAMMNGENMMDGEDKTLDKAPTAPLSTRGVYEDYSPDKLARAEDGVVVLFFHAKWCPTCRGLDSNIMGNISAIPDGVSILKVDYDDSTALKKKYGVTYQHTLVQVDAQGNQISKWSSSPTLSDIVKNIK